MAYLVTHSEHMQFKLHRPSSSSFSLSWNYYFFGMLFNSVHTVCSVFLPVFVYSSVGSVLLSITASAWQKYCYLQIEWVALIFLLAWGKQWGTRGSVYLALCHDCDEQHLNKSRTICSVWAYLLALHTADQTVKQVSGATDEIFFRVKV